MSDPSRVFTPVGAIRGVQKTPSTQEALLASSDPKSSIVQFTSVNLNPVASVARAERSAQIDRRRATEINTALNTQRDLAWAASELKTNKVKQSILELLLARSTPDLPSPAESECTEEPESEPVSLLAAHQQWLAKRSLSADLDTAQAEKSGDEVPTVVAYHFLAPAADEDWSSSADSPPPPAPLAAERPPREFIAKAPSPAPWAEARYDDALSRQPTSQCSPPGTATKSRTRSALLGSKRPNGEAAALNPQPPPMPSTRLFTEPSEAAETTEEVAALMDEATEVAAAMAAARAQEPPPPPLTASEASTTTELFLSDRPSPSLTPNQRSRVDEADTRPGPPPPSPAAPRRAHTPQGPFLPLRADVYKAGRSSAARQGLAACQHLARLRNAPIASTQTRAGRICQYNGVWLGRGAHSPPPPNRAGWGQHGPVAEDPPPDVLALDCCDPPRERSLRVQGAAKAAAGGERTERKSFEAWRTAHGPPKSKPPPPPPSSLRGSTVLKAAPLTTLALRDGAVDLKAVAAGAHAPGRGTAWNALQLTNGASKGTLTRVYDERGYAAAPFAPYTPTAPAYAATKVGWSLWSHTKQSLAATAAEGATSRAPPFEGKSFYEALEMGRIMHGRVQRNMFSGAVGSREWHARQLPIVWCGGEEREAHPWAPQ